jgi:hypothetical protein
MLSDQSARVQRVPAKRYEVTATLADIERAHHVRARFRLLVCGPTLLLQAFGYSPETSLEKGVERFVTWYKGHHEVRVHNDSVACAYKYLVCVAGCRSLVNTISLQLTAFCSCESISVM